MTEDGPASKAELMARVSERWSALNLLVSRLAEEELEAPLGDGWSVKVHLGHIAAWERSLAALLRGEDRGAAMGVPPELWAAHDTDAINSFLASRIAGLPVQTVLLASGGAHEQLLDLLGAMTEEDLIKPYSHYQPDPPPNTNPVVRWVNGNTWGHYDEHIGWIAADLRPAGMG